MVRVIHIFALCFLACAAWLPAQNNSVAPTSPMGWNSWDAYGLTIDEANCRATLKSDLPHFRRWLEGLTLVRWRHEPTC